MLQSLLLPAHVRLRSQMDEVLDMELIQQEVNHGALDLHRLAGYVINTMASLCAPVRDPEVRALRELKDPVELLRWGAAWKHLYRQSLEKKTPTYRFCLEFQWVHFVKSYFLLWFLPLFSVHFLLCLFFLPSSSSSSCKACFLLHKWSESCFTWTLFPLRSLRGIFRVLGLMKTDMVNFTIQSLRPHLLQQAVQYERAKFQQILDQQPGETAPATQREWWTAKVTLWLRSLRSLHISLFN